ncbi:hypothetical protein Dda_0250 [Drechslerella dactyloides]|uniref:Uncharacterized protein n=1 Tax=Drechslerella dactyloides TaxID=74499 RepID=A0AAD6J458_DREDA|nr:hypothetical protein Dda_0250 [Drechslerella dactyloides]
MMEMEDDVRASEPGAAKFDVKGGEKEEAQRANHSLHNRQAEQQEGRWGTTTNLAHNTKLENDINVPSSGAHAKKRPSQE